MAEMSLLVLWVVASELNTRNKVKLLYMDGYISNYALVQP